MRKLSSFLTLFSVVFLFVALFCYGQTAPMREWVVTYNGPGDSYDEAYDVAVDNKGNVYVTGTSYTSGNPRDIVTIKYDRDGNELWVRTYSSAGDYDDYPSALVIDKRGNVYVTGYNSKVPQPYPPDRDLLTIKYDSAGNLLWDNRYDGGYSDFGHDIAVDNKGNVCVTGNSWINASDWRRITIKYDRNGNELWREWDDRPGLDIVSTGNAIAVDNKGYVYVSGGIKRSTPGTGVDYGIIKYDRDGNILWVAYYLGPSNDYAWGGVAVDSKGNVHVTGDSWLGGYPDYVTVKCDRNGNILWDDRYGNPGSLMEEAIDLVLDHKGNVYVTGTSEGSGTMEDYATIKYDRDGNRLWIVRYDGPVNGVDRASGLVLDHKGNVYVTGWSRGSGTEYDYATVKYDRDGNRLWIDRYNSLANDYDYARAIAVDNKGNVYVTGSSEGNGSKTDFVTIKYRKQ